MPPRVYTARPAKNVGRHEAPARTGLRCQLPTKEVAMKILGTLLLLFVLALGGPALADEGGEVSAR